MKELRRNDRKFGAYSNLYELFEDIIISAKK